MSQSLDLQTQINLLAARVSVIDGEGLKAPAQGYTVQNNAAIAGIKEDLTQSVLSLEGLLQKINASVAGLWVALSTYLGLTPPPTPSTTVIPPAGS
jgi:hypothetical protein